VQLALLFSFDTQSLDAHLIITRTRATGLDLNSLTRFMNRARRQVGVSGEVNVLLTSNSEMRRLNSRYRNKNTPTDVLSFPAPEGNGVAGDIAISVDIAKQSARKRGESLGKEVHILMLHGLLHLAGYDHENDNGKMEREEQRLRKLLRLSTGLIERSRARHSSQATSSGPNPRALPTRSRTKRRP